MSDTASCQAVAARGRLSLVLVTLLALAAPITARPASAQARPSVSADTGRADSSARDSAAVDSSSASPLVPDTSVGDAADRGPHLVSGRVVRPTLRAMVPVPGIWVTLHRVGSDTAGPLDSMRTTRDGRYTFHYHHIGRADAVYFVSASYDGIAYFSSPLQKARVIGDDAEVTVYDTTQGPLPLHVRGRHVIISAPSGDGARQIVEVYELTNDSSVTLVAADDAHPTWRTIVPADAADFEVGQSDISPRSVKHTTGEVATVAPFAPGLKQISFAYHVPATAFPLSMPAEQGATVLEVLVEEPTAHVTGARLAPVEPVTIEGRRFQRFLAQDTPPHAVFTVTVPSAGGSPLTRRYVIIIAVVSSALMLAALALVLARRRRVAALRAAAPVAAAPPVVAASEDEAARLARTIATLDAELEARAAITPEDRAAYAAKRADLKRALAAALDARRRAG